MNIYRLVFNTFQENTYIVAASNGDCAVIDPGCSNENEQKSFKNFIEDKKLKPVKLINTHGHIDHILGNKFIIDTYNLPLYLNHEDNFLIENAHAHAAMYGFKVDTNYPLENDIAEKDVFEIDDIKLHVLHTPGHSPGSISLYNNENKFVLVGDVLFKGSIGRTDLPKGDYDVLMNSIFKKIAPLGDEFTVFSGHGPQTTIGEEMISNPFVIEQLNKDNN